MKDTNLLDLDLQLFTEDDNNNEEDNLLEDKELEDETTSEEETEKTYTQEELDKLLQQEGDRRVSSARKKFMKEYQEKIEEEKREAKRLAQLSAEERERELADKTKKELEETKAELRYIHLENDAIDRLNEENLPIEFKTFVIGKDEEETNERIKLFKEKWNKHLEEEVNKKLKGTTPRKSSTRIPNSNPVFKLSEMANKSRIIK